MKVLILNGSPRRRGETASLLDAFKKECQGQVREFFAFEGKIRSCTDCRYCRTHQGCAIQDGGQELMEAIAQSDCILIASPVWFGTLSGELLAMLSRTQQLFSAEFFRKEPKLASKKGGILLTAGGSGGTEGAIQTAAIILKQMGVSEIFPPICAKETDRRSASEDREALEGAKKLADYFNKK